MNSGKTKETGRSRKKFYQKKWFWGVAAVLLLVLVAVGVFAYKTGYMLNKISGGDGNPISTLFGGAVDLQEQEGRTNILLLGMRGADDPHGGLLADSIILLSINQKDNKVALISIPRDLYVQIPGTEERGKLNSVYAHWESGGKKQGIAKMEDMIGQIAGLKINYAIAINFEGFQQLIDAVGGVDIHLSKTFYETKQFVEGNECGGTFTLPAGTNHLDGTKALCYVRAREQTSDFDRSKRQQVVLKALETKMLSLGTLADFSKINNILNAIGDNVTTDMTPDEMKGLYGQYGNMKDAQIVQRVFENSEKGLLEVPAANTGLGYVLVPRAGQDNYSQMQEACRNVFVDEAQKDVDPVVQSGLPTTGSETKSTSKTGTSTSSK
ncbi:MAG: LCP family protein [Candidatus Moranbacteria bacterium]|nr:LCP family protein [Candidatus Moranbacteria bacterium]